jgi:hypothetical protein
MMQATFPCLMKYEGKNAATLQAVLLNIVHCSNFVICEWQCFRISIIRLHGYEKNYTLFSPLVEGFSYLEWQV